MTTKLRVTHLLDEADELLDNKFHIGSYCMFMNTDEIQDILSKIRAILPEEIKTAETILKRRDDIYMEAQNRAERIISEAQTKAASILSENELIRAVKEKAATIQEQLKESCDEMKTKAAEESETMRKNAYRDAMQTRESAKVFVEDILTNLERDIDKIHKHVKSCQEYLVSQQKDNDNCADVERQKALINDVYPDVKSKQEPIIKEAK